jgi:phosphoglycerol transferase
MRNSLDHMWYARSLGFQARPKIPATLVVCVLILTVAVLLIMKNVNLGIPIMAGDEYAYFGLSREFPAVDAVSVYDPTIQRTNNVVYFFVGRFLWDYTNDPAMSMRVLQSAVYALAMLILFKLCRQLLGAPSSLMVTAIVAASALSSYTAYFMPETIYIFLFFAIFLTLMRWSHRQIVCGIGAGFLVALLLLVKPHGLAVFLGVSASWCVFWIAPRHSGMARRESAMGLCTFVLSTYVCLVALNIVMTGNFDMNPMFVVGGFYAGFMSGGSRSLPAMADLGPVVMGNGAALALLIGFPLAYALIRCPPDLMRPAAPPEPRHRRLFVFATILILVNAAVVAMTVRFTAFVGGNEIWRIHGRYYSFVLPLYLVLMLAVQKLSAHSRPTATMNLRIVAALGLLLVAVLQFLWRQNYVIAPWDFPEIFAFSSWEWRPGAVALGTAVAVAGAIAFAAIILAPRHAALFFIVFFASLSVASLVQTTRWQFAHGRAFGVFAEPAMALRQLILPAAIDQGVNIGPDRGSLTYVLFNMRSRSKVVLLPPGSTVDASSVGGVPPWILLQGSYDIRVEGMHPAYKTDKLTFLTRGGPPLPIGGAQ